MSSVTVYCINNDQGGSTYFATLAEARAYYKSYSAELYGGIERLTLVDLPPRNLAAKLLNGQQFVVTREEVKP